MSEVPPNGDSDGPGGLQQRTPSRLRSRRAAFAIAPPTLPHCDEPIIALANGEEQLEKWMDTDDILTPRRHLEPPNDFELPPPALIAVLPQDSIMPSHIHHHNKTTQPMPQTHQPTHTQYDHLHSTHRTHSSPTAAHSHSHPSDDADHPELPPPRRSQPLKPDSSPTLGPMMFDMDLSSSPELQPEPATSDNVPPLNAGDSLGSLGSSNRSSLSSKLSSLSLWSADGQSGLTPYHSPSHGQEAHGHEAPSYPDFHSTNPLAIPHGGRTRSCILPVALKTHHPSSLGIETGGLKNYTYSDSTIYRTLRAPNSGGLVGTGRGGSRTGPAMRGANRSNSLAVGIGGSIACMHGLASAACRHCYLRPLGTTSTDVGTPTASIATTVGGSESTTATNTTTTTTINSPECTSLLSAEEDVARIEEQQWAVLSSLQFPPPPPLPFLKPLAHSHLGMPSPELLPSGARAPHPSPEHQVVVRIRKYGSSPQQASPHAMPPPQITQPAPSSQQLIARRLSIAGVPVGTTLEQLEAQQNLLNAALADRHPTVSVYPAPIALPVHLHAQTAAPGVDALLLPTATTSSSQNRSSSNSPFTTPNSQGVTPKTRCWNKSWMADLESEPEKQLLAEQAERAKERQAKLLKQSTTSSSSSSVTTTPLVSARQIRKEAKLREELQEDAAVFEMDL